jgi:hypothetical protein
MFASLPPQVQNAVRAETGSAEITNVMKLDLARGPVYEISFQDPKEYPTIYIAQDGSVLDTNLTVAVGAPVEPASTLTGGGASGLAIQDLPAAVIKTVQERAPLSTVTLISKEAWGGRNVYIISFTDPVNHPKVYIASDGTVLKDTHQ